MDGRDLKEIPEVAALDRGRALIRIPPETDIPVTPRVLRILETTAFRRLQRISQLGLVSLVYPGATHTRFQHSLGVYRMGLLYLKSLGDDDTFRHQVSIQDAERFIVACLVHDIGHWPYCHPLEDLKLPGIPRHEALARDLIS
ncbi:MAG: HD domain-containing protein, partial [Pirellulales bacterium]